MKQKATIFGIIIMLVTILSNCTRQSDFPVLEGPYLGQKPPGMKPEIFAEGIISTDSMEGCSWFSEDNSFFLFVRRGSGIMIMEQVNGIWSIPKNVTFHVDDCDWDFSLSQDSRFLYVASLRPDDPDQEILEYCRIWKVERRSNIWFEPELLPYPVNTGQHDSHPSVSNNGTLYFFSYRDGGYGKGDLYKSELVHGQYKKVKNLGKVLNTSSMEGDPFIAPDQSYIIYCSYKEGGLGGCDIYISFNIDGEWSVPLNLGDKINTNKDEWMPYITPDGKYFFYTSDITGGRDIYWVDAKVIEELIPDELK